MTRRSALVAALLLLCACDDAFVPTPTVDLSRAALDPAVWLDTLDLLDTLTVSLRLVDQSGDEVTGPVVTYASTVPEVLVAIPTPDGAQLAALTVGVAQIVAYVNDPRYSTDTLVHRIVVKPPEVSWPAAMNLTDVDTVRVTLSPRYSGGRITWRSSNENLLTIRAVDAAAQPLDTVAEIQTLGTGRANVVLSATGASLIAREVSLPVRVNQKWSQVDAGYNHTCALTVAGTAYCWGANSYGELGDGSFASRSRPAVVATPLKFDGVGAGGVASGLQAPQAHSCGRLGTQIFCWGSFQNDQLGNDVGSCSDPFNPTACVSPLPVQSNTDGFSLAVGGTLTCAVRPGDPPGARCWGGEYVGSGIASGGGGTLMGDAGGEHVCFTAFTGFGTPGTRCAGRNDAGQLGDGTTTNQLNGGIGGEVFAPGAIRLEYNEGAFGGGKHTCTVDRNQGPRAVYCWGWNGNGQLGPNGPGAGTSPCPAGACSRTPVAVPVSADVAVGGLMLGWAHSCFLSTGGEAYCWGRNTEGQLGDGTTASRSTAVRAAPGLLFTSLSAGDTHTCGIDTSGSMYCWGNNGSGRLGDGSSTSSPVPVRVAEPVGG